VVSELRILLFDWTTGGHHHRYVQRFAQALDGNGEIAAAIPDGAESIPGLARILPLGPARPAVDVRLPLAPQHKELAHRELALLDQAIAELRPDHVVHLYADPVLRRLVGRPAYPCKVTLCVFFPRAHYPSVYGTHLGAAELARAWFHEYLVTRWRGRPDANAILTLDEAAAQRWSRRTGAPSYWLPEPPVVAPSPSEAAQRVGCVMYGALAPRKGIALLADAVAAGAIVPVHIAGSVEPGFETELARLVARMQAAGAEVTVAPRSHSEAEGLTALAQACCAVLPYPRHYTMSRVLLEAAHVGTPVVVHDRGMLAYLVRRHGLGVAVDCTDAVALRRALLDLCEPGRTRGFGPALARFAARYSSAAFREAVTAPFRSAGSHPAATRNAALPRHLSVPAN
jgi:glycosyltransferase involved in cell wall biosynthesis